MGCGDTSPSLRLARPVQPALAAPDPQTWRLEKLKKVGNGEIHCEHSRTSAVTPSKLWSLAIDKPKKPLGFVSRRNSATLIPESARLNAANSDNEVSRRSNKKIEPVETAMSTAVSEIAAKPTAKGAIDPESLQNRGSIVIFWLPQRRWLSQFGSLTQPTRPHRNNRMVDNLAQHSLARWAFCSRVRFLKLFAPR